MKVEASLTTKLSISDLEGLDPIGVFIEDAGPGRGSIVVRCHTQTWSASWGAMGKENTAAQFVTSCSPDYLIGCLSPMLRKVRFSSDALIIMAKRSVIDRRRGRNSSDWIGLDDLDRRQARALFDQVDDLDGITEVDCWRSNSLLVELFGCEWWHKADDATEPNPEWAYLERILETVQAAIKQQSEVPA